MRTTHEYRAGGHLPHFHRLGTPQSITFRLEDALPASVVRQIAAEARGSSRALQNAQLRRDVDRFLDLGLGAAVLAEPSVATIVEEELLREEGPELQLHAWVVMPTHVHAAVTWHRGSMAETVQRWKGRSARRINLHLGRTGRLWQPDYFDRAIETPSALTGIAEYIEFNPVKAGLCEQPEEWRFSSARRRMASRGALH